ncbi:MAG: hypothetical protein ABJ242_08160 [Marinomonas sp.]
MKTITKAIAGTVAAGAMAMTSAAPAYAGNHRDRVDAGDIIAGALILGGIAAVASSVGNKRGYRDRNYRSNNYYSQGNPRAAVERCVRVAERRAKRAGYRFADVTRIRDVESTRYGWKVKGRMVVDGARGYRGANNGHRYNDRYRHDDRGYGYYNRGSRADRGKFTCYVERGSRPQVNFRGIRGL